MSRFESGSAARTFCGKIRILSEVFGRMMSGVIAKIPA
jgi:hypothetical protein